MCVFGLFKGCVCVCVFRGEGVLVSSFCGVWCCVILVDVCVCVYVCCWVDFVNCSITCFFFGGGRILRLCASS